MRELMFSAVGTGPGRSGPSFDLRLQAESPADFVFGFDEIDPAVERGIHGARSMASARQPKVFDSHAPQFPAREAA